MSENKTTDISKAQTLEEIGDFWDTHSLDDYWEQTEEAVFEVRTTRRRRVTLAPEIYEKLEAQARVKGVLPETLANIWLAEHLRKVE